MKIYSFKLFMINEDMFVQIIHEKIKCVRSKAVSEEMFDNPFIKCFVNLDLHPGVISMFIIIGE